MVQESSRDFQLRWALSDCQPEQKEELMYLSKYFKAKKKKKTRKIDIFSMDLKSSAGSLFKNSINHSLFFSCTLQAYVEKWNVKGR